MILFSKSKALKLEQICVILVYPPATGTVNLKLSPSPSYRRFSLRNPAVLSRDGRHALNALEQGDNNMTAHHHALSLAEHYQFQAASISALPWIFLRNPAVLS